MTTTQLDTMKSTLRTLLRDTMQARFEGGRYSELARAHGYVDGYMRALRDSGLVGDEELLEIVGTERRRFVDTASGQTHAAVG